MRTLTEREQRTVRFGAIAIGIYLLIFGGMSTWKFCQQSQSDYARLVREGESLKRETQLYEDKAAKLKSMMEAFNLDPAKLSSTTAVAQASAAIQTAAAGRGIMVGPVRESPSRTAGKELATVQLEAAGPVPAITGFLSRLESIGFPLIVESVQFSQEPTRPGQLKLTLTILVLDFDQWKKEGAPSA